MLHRPRRWRSASTGYSIVELLIVIVVIGILAMLAINSYADAQRKAYNAQIIATANVYQKALTFYAQNHGAYPMDRSHCLGTGYPDLDGNGVAGDCALSDTGWAYNYEDSEATTKLAPYVEAGAKPAMDRITGDGYTQIGLSYENMDIHDFMIDGVEHPWYLTYMLKGTNEKCTLGPVIHYETEYNNFTTLDSGPSEIQDQGIKCWVPLPDPAKLKRV